MGKFDPGALYCAAVEIGNASVFQFMLEQVIEDNKKSGESWYASSDMCKSLACAKNEDLVASLLSENSELARMEFKRDTLDCYREYLPHEIFLKKPVTMIKSVYDFWMRETLNGTMVPGSFMRHLWVLVPRVYEPPGFIDGVLYKTFN